MPPLDIESVEKMAREYSQSLANYNISDSSSNLIERIIVIVENQLEIINYLVCVVQSRPSSKILNYLKTLKTTSVMALNKLANKGDYVPAFRNSERTIGYQASYARLVNMQIDIFVLLDKLAQEKNNITDVLILENRAMGIISIIGR